MMAIICGLDEKERTCYKEEDRKYESTLRMRLVGK